MLLVKKCSFFLELFSVKIRLEIMFNNVIDGKETFFGKKTSIFQSPKHRIFPKGLTHAFHQRMYVFIYLFLVKIRPEIMFNNVIDGKETFFRKKIQSFKVPKIAFFQRG